LNRQLSHAIVGADHPNKGKGPSRRFAIALCKPGDPVRLISEPRNPADPQAMQVLEASGIVMGYVRAEQAQWIGKLWREARITAIIFQQATKFGCYVRLGLDGEAPILPPPPDPNVTPDDSGFYPDEIWPDD
jgi:hypothetical protein